MPAHNLCARCAVERLAAAARHLRAQRRRRISNSECVMRELTPEENERVWLVGYSGRDDADALRAGSTASNDKPLLALLEAGGVNDLPVVMPAAEATSDAVIEAIKTLKAAGYRISKPRKPKIFKRGKDRVGPTFVCEFSDGVTTRMSVYTALEKLDWARGERLARAAHQSRWRTRMRAQYRKQTGSPCSSILLHRFRRQSFRRVLSKTATSWLNVIARLSRDRVTINEKENDNG